MREETFKVEVLRTLDTLNIQEATVVANNIIESSGASDKKKLLLKESIKKARRSKDISFIMWNAYLSGEGLGTFTSSWCKI